MDREVQLGRTGQRYFWEVFRSIHGDRVTGSADLNFLREVEQSLEPFPPNIESWRESIQALVARLAMRGQTIQWNSHPQLAHAIEQFVDVRMRRVRTGTSIRPRHNWLVEGF